MCEWWTGSCQWMFHQSASLIPPHPTYTHSSTSPSHSDIKQQQRWIPILENNTGSGVGRIGWAVYTASRIVRDRRRRKLKIGKKQQWKTMKSAFFPSFMLFLETSHTNSSSSRSSYSLWQHGPKWTLCCKTSKAHLVQGVSVCATCMYRGPSWAGYQ